jgi:hypothetical protein
MADHEQIVRDFHERAPNWEAVLHPEIEVRLLATFDEVVSGRDEVVKALTEGRGAALYAGQITRVDPVDDSAVISIGNVRYALAGGGLAHGTGVWLDEFRDGLLWRSRVYKTGAEALAAYDAERAA